MSGTRSLPAPWRGVLLAVVMAAWADAALGQDDLPGRVGRIADTGGRVYFSTEEQPEDWIEAVRNATVTSGDNLWASEGANAEVDYGGGQFRLAGDSNVHIARIDDRTLALFVAQGSVVVRVRVLDPGESARVDTPNTQFSLNRPGSYRIDVSEDRVRSTLVVREGEATVALTGTLQQVLPGQTATVIGDLPNYADVRNGFSQDGFDAWSESRDRRYDRSKSANYVSRQMIGYADLDEYGGWQSYPEYGAVWFPSAVASDWAPYRFGRWTWVSGWGWTWVDDAPWGYAPFHYGRWIHVANRWGWVPGGYVARPVWAPALVGWIGDSGFSMTVSVGGPVYGWVPLGWGEPYLPWWRNCSNRCWTRYNRPYAVNHAERPSAPPTRYRNWTVPGGATAVAGATLTQRRPVQANLVPVRPGPLTASAVLPQAPQVERPRPAATIPGAKPTYGQVPPAPPSRFYRTQPRQGESGPAERRGFTPAPPPSSAGTPANRGGAAAPPARGGGETAPHRGGPAYAAPGTGTPPPNAAAPGASQDRPAGRGEYPRGTWGAPPNAAAQPAGPASNPVVPAPVTRTAPPRPEPRAVLPPSNPPATRSAPPAAYVAPVVPNTPAVRPQQAPSAHPPVPRQASQPPAAPPPVARPVPPPAGQAPPPQPQAGSAPPQGGRGSSPAQRPPPKGDGDNYGNNNPRAVPR